MTPEEKIAKDQLFIAPYDHEGLSGWLVKISWYPNDRYESRKWHSKLFRFSAFGSEEETLNAARQYRDKWIEDNKEKRYLSGRDSSNLVGRFSLSLQSNNTSGIVGVTRSDKASKRGPLWQTTFARPGGGVDNRKFLISTFGEVGALRKAIEARREGLLTLFHSRGVGEGESVYDVIKFYDDILANLVDFHDPTPGPSVIEIVRKQDIPATSKLEQIQIRIGQQRFRREVLEFFDYKCAITGSSLLIRASHIKPWRLASDEERLNPSNGLALSPVYDAAFDLGLIAFRPDGQILLSEIILADGSALGISGTERIVSLTDEHQVFLDWHRKNIFTAMKVAK